MGNYKVYFCEWTSGLGGNIVQRYLYVRLCPPFRLSDFCASLVAANLRNVSVKLFLTKGQLIQPNRTLFFKRYT